MKKYVVLFLFISLVGCFDPGFASDEGIGFVALNTSENAYGKTTFYIGGVKEDTFVVTDSIISEEFIDERISSTEGSNKTLINDWQPDFDKIKNISNNGLVLIKLSSEERIFINPFTLSPRTFARGTLSVFITEYGLVDYEDPDGLIRQDLEVVK